MRSYQELVAEAEAADVTGWDFSWLAGRASEERPPWGYARLMAASLAEVDSALDLDTGGGEVLDEAPSLPALMVATESWAPNAALARARLAPRGVRVVATEHGADLPLPDESFDLVTARHPVAPNWPHIHRVLRPGGRYLAQHVGPASALELIELFLGPTPDAGASRHPEREAQEARRAGLRIEEVRTARCRMEFFDVGAVVWILRRCLWWVPDFSVDRYQPVLRELDTMMRAGEPLVAHSTRHLVRAYR